MWVELGLDELWELEAQLEEKVCAEDATSDYIAAYEAEAELDVLRDVIRMQIENSRQREG